MNFKKIYVCNPIRDIYKFDLYLNKIKHKLNSIKLKKDIEKLYLRSLEIKEPLFTNYLDSIKSVIGMDLDSINYNLIKLFEKKN